jgi:hypothetical protein
LSRRKNALQWGGFVVILVLAELFLGLGGIIGGALLALFYFPVFIALERNRTIELQD